MANFVITFPEKNRERRDGWVRVVNAKNVEQVKNYAEHAYQDYSMIYAEENFHEGYFPHGCLEEVDFRGWHDYVT